VAHRVGVVIANGQKATLIDHLKINSLLETLAARKRIVLVVKVLTFLYLLITKDSHPPFISLVGETLTRNAITYRKTKTPTRDKIPSVPGRNVHGLFAIDRSGTLKHGCLDR
jgi:hypothetical protein